MRGESVHLHLNSCLFCINFAYFTSPTTNNFRYLCVQQGENKNERKTEKNIKKREEERKKKDEDANNTIKLQELSTQKWNR